METKAFTIYRSSAGSGKTRTLAKEYLKLALRHRADYFRHILAVTFTNKATQEMKDRILEYLDAFANDRPNELADELKKELALDDLTFREHAREVQSRILHTYAQFSISTIDAFFQKVIRSFTREAGLVGDYRLEIDQDEVMEQVIDNLVDELGTHEELTRWVVEFATENLENERTWDVRQSLIEFSREIFREDFKAVEDTIAEATARPGFFPELLNKLKAQKYQFVKAQRSRANEAIQALHQRGLREFDFKYKSRGSVYGFFKDVAVATSVSRVLEKLAGARVQNEFPFSRNWPDKDTRHRQAIVQVADDQLIGVLTDMVELGRKEGERALSAEVAMNNFYAFGLIADISRKLKEYKEENNMMLLADAPKFLNGVIRDSDTPFIYEKVGSFFRNYLIDEFQDTSGLQWRNFLPLVANSLDQGYRSLVVGDVKQAIYRWRGGDLTLLQQHVENNIGEFRVDSRELDTNYRSASAVVDLNNKLFRAAATIVAAETGAALPSDAYRDVEQKPSKKKEGYVRIQFLQDAEDYTWKDAALDLIPQYLEQLQEKGVPLGDIAVLVRKNDDGQRVATHLLQYKNSEKAKPGFRYDVVSNELLRIDGAATVNLLISALQYLLNPDDAIARAQLAYEYAKLHEPGRELRDVFAVSNQVTFENNLPPAFAREKISLRKLPVIELTETLIEIFRLGNVSGELVYLQAFQDSVLEFSSRERNDLGAFLEWWELNKHKKSIKVSEDVDAVQIYTVHKSKGLQFRYVIIPFCAWSMDHEFGKAPNLWVNSAEPPFDEAGFVPVRYSSTLEDTYFREAYATEKMQSHLDNLNLLYVAFTRAEQGLFVLAPSPEVKGSKNTVAGLIFRSISQSSELAPSWKAGEELWENGKLEASGEVKKEAYVKLIDLVRYGSSRWRDKLVIRHSGARYFKDLEGEREERARYGIYLHELLSRIRYADELNDVFTDLVHEGLIIDSEREEVYRQISELLQHPVVASWFSRAWEVRTEAPILLPGGKENRIDRLLTRDNQAVVIDFKTGEPSRNDQKQVMEYTDILRKMNFTSVDGYILYVKNGDIVTVTNQKVRKTKTKDENQLGIPGLM
jgi:ATP-dependent helicase/nuclease subunit A